MTFSFREEAAIRFSTELFHSGYTREPSDAVLKAQGVADACCKAWGHVHYNDNLEAIRWCERCGERNCGPTPDEVVDAARETHAFMEKQLRERDAAIEAAQVERDAARVALCDVLDALGVDDPKDAKREIHRLKAGGA